MTGLVVRSTGSFYEVLTADGQRITCKARGKLRLEGYTETNPIAVGDRVDFEIENEYGTISAIHPRRNHVLRKAINKAGYVHVLAANVDQVLVVFTLKQPRTSLGFIDRMLVSAESFRIPQLIVFNKKDMLDEEEKSLVEEYIRMYRAIDVTCFFVSAAQDDLEELWKALEGRVTLVAGHSGVGKSTLLNKLAPGIAQSIADVSAFTQKGKHTTTFAEMFPLGNNTFIIDTPGLKELGLADMTPQEISDYFPEMRELRLNCKYGARCLHLQEPGCAILEALHTGRIATSRYDSYERMVRDEDNKR